MTSATLIFAALVFALVLMLSLALLSRWLPDPGRERLDRLSRSNAQHNGQTAHTSVWQQALPPVPYRALVLPFLDYPLAMDLLSGSLQSPVARRLHDALLSGLTVLALRYQMWRLG